VITHTPLVSIRSLFETNLATRIDTFSLGGGAIRKTDFRP